MIVCSCNRITDRAVRACAAASAGRPLRAIDVYGALGCKPECGRCAPTIAAILRERRSVDCDGARRACTDAGAGVAAA